MSRRLWLLLPLLVFVGFVAAAAWRLSDPPDTTIKSRMVGRSVPAFNTAPMLPGRPGLASAELGKGKPRQKRGVVIDGIALRDQPQDIAKFLADNGDPFAAIGSDPVGEAQIAMGSSGVPESFIVDGQGVIRYQHIGPITPEQLGEVMDEWGRAQ
jgi:cytochrome c biogenesis protein CcmG/thiol:disulfide interchange protein DsbE